MNSGSATRNSRRCDANANEIEKTRVNPCEFILFFGCGQVEENPDQCAVTNGRVEQRREKALDLMRCCARARATSCRPGDG